MRCCPASLSRKNLTIAAIIGAIVIAASSSSSPQTDIKGTSTTPSSAQAIYSTPTNPPTLTPTDAPTPTKIYVTPTNTPAPTVIPSQSGLSNDNYYTNNAGSEIHSPAYSNSVPSGATAICGDGTYSFSQSRRGTCSHHGGVSQWL